MPNSSLKSSRSDGNANAATESLATDRAGGTVTVRVFSAPPQPDRAYIRDMFDGMARRYSLFAALIGFGQDHRLRRAALAPLRPGMRVLDIGCGTGELTLDAARRCGSDGHVTGLDISPRMLAFAEERMTRARRVRWPRRHARDGRARRADSRPELASVSWVNVPADRLPLDEPRFDIVISAYVLRNLYEHLDNVLAGMHASLRPGGRLSLLDLTEPTHPIKRRIFHAYLTYVVGLYGLLLFGRKYPVPYLPDSARRFPTAQELTDKLTLAGFVDVTATPFMLGAVTLYSAARE